jgi:hypothetical protein
VIICKKCGNHNEDRDEFCVSCGAFLEWSGERVAQPAPPPPPEAPPPPPPPPGLVERVKQAVGLEGQRGPTAATPPTAEAGQKAPPPPPTGGGWVAPASLDTPGTSSGVGTPAQLEAPPASSAAPPQQPVTTSAREPQAVTPAAPRPRTVPRTTAPELRHEPGDLICGQCGTGNRSTRHFCQRCGASLAEAPVVRTPWYRRLFRPRQPSAAAGRRAASDSAGTRTDSPVRSFVLAALAVVVVGGVLAYAAIPSFHRRVDQDASGIGTQVGRAIDPTYVPVTPIQTTASSELAGHPASFATDLVSNDYWAASRTADPQPTLAVRFAGPTDLDSMVIHSGAGPDYARLARPRTVQVTYSDGTGQLLTLKDDPKPTSYPIHASHVTSLTLQITGVYPAGQSSAVAIAEVEFFRLK